MIATGVQFPIFTKNFAVFFLTFWQNRSKHHGQKVAKVELQNFWHLEATSPKKHQKRVGG
jgi:hypothetical protein